MKIKRFMSFGSALFLSLSSLLVFAPAVAHAVAQNCQWTGATNDNFNVATNWSSCSGAIPQAGDNLIFDNTSLTSIKTLNNDITSASFGSITFQGTGSNIFEITGNAMSLDSGITFTVASSIEVDLALTADQTITASVAGAGLGDLTPKTLNMNGHNLIISGSSFILADDIAGAGNINAQSDVSLSGTNTSWTGNLTATSSNVSLGKPASLGASSNAVTVSTGGSVTFCKFQGATVPQNFSLGGSSVSLSSASSCGLGGPGGSSSDPGANVTLSGTVTLGADTAVTSAGIMTLTGPLTGSHKLDFASGQTGSLVINSSNNTSQTANGTYVSAVKIVTIDASDNQPATAVSINNKETYIINGKRGAITVNAGGILKGTGTVGTINLFGELAPGQSPGCLSSGNLTFNAGSTYDFEVGGTTPCTEYDQMKVTGTVTINGGTLSTILYNGFKPIAGQSYTIVDNDGADAVTGTFDNMAEGSTFTVSGYVFQITYKGGDGNDVVLTVKSVPATPDTGFRFIMNNPLTTLFLISSLTLGIVLIARRYHSNT